ncbi:MAG TPA: NFACT RNA binding domain-containing protein [Anaeromyxobacteraceae bacterium]|nr:NFACT RNA binding domain-containing protein [Anaeromyxobacteraceae bacterium]
MGCRISLHASEIAAVVQELQPLVGARVDAVRVHAERAITLELFGRAGGATVLLSAEADLTRLHAVERRPPPPPAPLALQTLLRRELEGARLAAISARTGERVVELGFDAPAGPLRLVAELTGRHGNIFLVGADGIIRASAGRNLSQRRELVVGKPYAPPADRARAADSSEVDHTPSPRVSGERAGERGGFPLSAALEARYAVIEADRAAAEGRKRLREPVRAALARARRALEKLTEEAARVPAAEEDRRRADLLKQQLHGLTRGAREAVLTEWTAEGAREVRVALDPALGPRENMERYYRRYRRIAESAARVAARAAEVRGREGELTALLAELERAPQDALPRLEREARRLGAAPRAAPRPRSKRDLPLPPYRLFRSIAGTAVLVGRNAEANDALTVKHARGNDLWLHARGLAGSHVVVKLEKGRAPDGETLLDAAHLAAWFSDGRGEPQLEVVSTRAKYVRKVKGSAPGAVNFSQERTTLLRVDRARIERLLASEEEQAP